MRKAKSKAAYMISSVAEQYGIHPQTLRLYEREGLLKPSRSEGNTRLYTSEDLERLAVILHLTRDLVLLLQRDVAARMDQRLAEIRLDLREELHNTHILLAQITARIPALATGDEPPSDPPDAPEQIPSG